MKTIELVNYLNDYLNVSAFKDYAPNGLQVQGTNEIKTIVTGVTACQALLDEAVKRKADAVLVHHGYFWKGEDPCVVGMKQKRLKTLLENNINLLGYHLPLDAHLDVGNNVGLAKAMGWMHTGQFKTPTTPSIGFLGAPQAPCSTDELAEQCEDVLGQTPLVIEGHDRPIKTIAWCTGGAQDYIEAAAAAGADAYITGEVSERTVHQARELGITFIAAGHHATETFGAKALGEHLAQQFDLKVDFVNVPNPV
jgi:dinuclear metal center YbgI/SA1388 family protein